MTDKILLKIKHTC